MTDLSGWHLVERLVMLLGLVSIAFAAGMNWHRLDGLDAAVLQLSRQEDVIKAEYQRRDVLEAELRAINDKLDAIRQQPR
jgi:Tfp pilus assembly protein PilO